MSTRLSWRSERAGAGLTSSPSLSSPLSSSPPSSSLAAESTIRLKSNRVEDRSLCISAEKGGEK